MVSDDELVERGQAIFRTIAARDARGLCVQRISKDRYCPRPSRSQQRGSLYCDKHRPVEPPEDDRGEGAM